MDKRELLKASAAMAAAEMMTTFAEHGAFAGTMTQSQLVLANNIFQGETVPEVQAVIRSIAGGRGLGTHHSLDEIADPTLRKSPHSS